MIEIGNGKEISILRYIVENYTFLFFRQTFLTNCFMNNFLFNHQRNTKMCLVSTCWNWECFVYNLELQCYQMLVWLLSDFLKKLFLFPRSSWIWGFLLSYSWFHGSKDVFSFMFAFCHNFVPFIQCWFWISHQDC